MTPDRIQFATDIRSDDFDALHSQADEWRMGNALSPVWLVSQRTVEAVTELLRFPSDGKQPDSAFGIPLDLDDTIPDGFFRPSCRHAWFNAGYQTQANPPLWLECCRYCPEQRLTPVAPTPESAHPYSGVLRQLNQPRSDS